MTRFNISLIDGVKFVIESFKKMFGGEIFVPKLYSYNILDVAKAIDPACKLKIVGIRPGEKLHEEMISISESLNTVEGNNWYAILPKSEFVKWKEKDFLKKNMCKKIKKPFSYNSFDNKKYLKATELKFLQKNLFLIMKINYGKQSVNQDDIRSVVKVLKSDFLTTGPKILDFESELKKFMGSKFCTAVSNGTAALHLVGLVEKWNKDDLILTSPISFLASANCAIYNNAKIDFIDIDEDTYTLNIEKLEKKLKVKKNVKAVIAVDYAGHPCDWKKLKSLSIKYNFKLINDNCHAIGTKYFNRFDYAIKYADYVTHSYHPVKNITTGEGGAIFTNIKRVTTNLKFLEVMEC